jgi:hypothetical protein
MAAEPPPATLNAALRGMAFSPKAADVLTDPDKESVTVDNLHNFDEDGVKKLCAALRKHGGLINGLPLPDGTIPRLPNPGVNISQWAEMNLTTACYMANHYV